MGTTGLLIHPSFSHLSASTAVVKQLHDLLNRGDRYFSQSGPDYLALVFADGDRACLIVRSGCQQINQILQPEWVSEDSQFPTGDLPRCTAPES